MSVNYNYGWIKDSDGSNFAPITTIDQVLLSDSTSLSAELLNIQNILTEQDGQIEAINVNTILLTERTSNVDNTSDANKPVSTAQKAAIDAVQTNVNTVDDKVDDHIADADVHFTAAERTKLAGIATGANKYTHPTSGVTAGTYKSVTVDANGHVTGGSNPTTLAGYGITDAEVKGTVSSHNTSTSAHNDIRLLISDVSTKLNNFLNVNDTTKDQLSEIIALIEENADDIESITSGKINVSDIVNNLTTNVSNKPLSAAQGVAIKALIDSLQDALDTDKANLTNHTGNTTVHITSTERTNWNDANSKKHSHSNKTVLDNTTASYTTAEQTKLSGIATGAEVNQNAFSNIKVGSTTVAADSKTDTVEFVGSNVTITPDATNDKITFAVANGTTSAVGIVKLTDSVSSTDTTTAATPKNVKAAYDLANTANTKAANAQTTADGKSDKGHKHTVSEITDLTATATELNYMDGVTSNVQTQLDSLDSNSIKSELVDVVEGEEPTMSAIVDARFIALENRVTTVENEFDTVARLSDIDDALANFSGGATDFSDMTATDTSGFLGTANASVNAQSLINKMAEKILSIEDIIGYAITELSSI